MILSKWKTLEDYVVKLLHEDSARTTPGSGSSKHEEDVIGKSIIAQCKQTDHSNSSILQKDLDRLIDACNLHNKFPMFITKNLTDTILSIPITDNTDNIINNLINLICYLKTEEKLNLLIDSINDTSDFKDILLIEKEINNLENKKTKLNKNLFNNTNILKSKFKIKFDTVTMGDLFN